MKLKKSFVAILCILMMGVIFYHSELVLEGVREIASFGEIDDSTRNDMLKNDLNDIAAMTETGALEEEDGEESTSFGAIGLDEDKMREVAQNIFNVGNAMTDKYSVSDGLSMAAYILRYMAEIGEYELVAKDIMKLVKAFENLKGEELNIDVMLFIKQIRKIKFGKSGGKFYAKFYSKNKREGIITQINERSTDPDSSLKEILYVRVKDGSEVKFEDVDTKAEKDAITDLIKQKVRVIGLFKNKGLNQIHPDIVDNIDMYLAQPEFPATPLYMTFDGIYVHVDTSTMFKKIKFWFKEAVALPGYRKQNDEPIPSFTLRAKAKLLDLKVSIDQ